MKRLADLFARKKNNVLNVYCTAGFPAGDSTMEVLTALQENGADLIEIGMPYSDPLADGPVIQASGSRALENGMTITRLFEQLKDFRQSIKVPVVLMGYMNPVLQFGFEKFCRTAAAVGVDGLILPDLPIYEFETEYGAIIRDNGLDFIFLVTPETDEARIRKTGCVEFGFFVCCFFIFHDWRAPGHERSKRLFAKTASHEIKKPCAGRFWYQGPGKFPGSLSLYQRRYYWKRLYKSVRIREFS